MDLQRLLAERDERIVDLELALESAIDYSEASKADLREARDALAAALRGCMHEMTGVLEAYGEQLRPIMGNTNLHVLEHWRDRARAALEQHAPEQPE